MITINTQETLIFNVLCTDSADWSTSVDYAVTTGNATLGSDFTLSTGNISWADGDNTVKTIYVGILDCSASE